MPAHIRFAVHGPLAAFERRKVKGAPRARGEAGAVQKDATLLDDSRSYDAVGKLLVPPRSFRTARELPFGGVELRDGPCNDHEVFGIGEGSALGATAVGTS